MPNLIQFDLTSNSQLSRQLTPRMGGAAGGGDGGTGPPLSKVSGVQYPAILGEPGGPIGRRRRDYAQSFITSTGLVFSLQ